MKERKFLFEHAKYDLKIESHSSVCVKRTTDEFTFHDLHLSIQFSFLLFLFSSALFFLHFLLCSVRNLPRSSIVICLTCCTFFVSHTIVYDSMSIALNRKMAIEKKLFLSVQSKEHQQR